jgi:hypothetical protein
MEASVGRCSRRFRLDAEIPNGVITFKLKHKPLPLNEIEQLQLLQSMGGVIGWQLAIMRHERYALKLFTSIAVLLVALFSLPTGIGDILRLFNDVSVRE